jgi:signal transduction histidine kinase
MQAVIDSKPRRSLVEYSNAISLHKFVRSSLFLALDLPLGIIFFTVIFTLLTTSIALVVLLPFAFVLAWITIRLSDLFMRLEASRFQLMLGVDLAIPAQVIRATKLGHKQNWVRQTWADVRSPRTWGQVKYHVLMLPIGVISWSMMVLCWCVPVLLLLSPLLTQTMHGRYAELFFVQIRSGVSSIIASIIGGLLCVGAIWIVPQIVTLRTSLALRLLAQQDPTDLKARVTELESSRTAVVEAADAERRRIERDLHDGAQQRLVAVAMDLGMARKKLQNNTAVPDDVRTLIDNAHDEAKRAITELRNVARGIYPTILEDRGLSAAVSALAGRCPMPVDVKLQTDPRPSRAVEAVMYYVIAESLTNIAKHAHASQVHIESAVNGNRIKLTISDNGAGGAKVGPAGGFGGGLAGLRDRVHAVDGTFIVRSPINGPTVVSVELPCG